MRVRAPLRKATRPMTNSTGAAAAMLNDSTCTISVVPTLAPSMIASAGTRPTMPSAANEAVISAGRGAALKQRGQAEAGGEGGEAVAERLRQQTPQIGAERAQDAAVDHVQAPQQQRHAAHQVEKNERAHRLISARELPAANTPMHAQMPRRVIRTQ